MMQVRQRGEVGILVACDNPINAKVVTMTETLLHVSSSFLPLSSPSPLRPVYSEQTVALSNGIELAYVTTGESGSVPLVFLHGWSDSWRSWEPVLPYLPHSLKAFAVTVRGHGNSSKPPSGYRLSNFAADVAAFLDEIGIDAAVIVGHSMGTSIAQRFALDFPERTLGTVLLGAIRTWRRMIDIDALRAAAHSLSDPVDPNFVRDFQLGTIAQPVLAEHVERFIEESLKLPAQVWQDTIEEFLADNTFTQIASIDAPTLLIWGSCDSVTSRAEQDVMVSTIPRARLIVYAGNGHALHWEQPERAAADIAAFVSTLSR